MSLILSVNGRDSIWLLADRRLSFQGRAPKDDARKVMFLETPDGVAILGYAGLGATSRGTEPSDWMSAVLRGRKLTIDQSVGVLAAASNRQLPQHLLQVPAPGAAAHDILITAFVGNEVRLYSIDLVLSGDRRKYRSRHTRHVVNRLGVATLRAPRFGLAGSGAIALIRDRKWIRPLLRLVRAYDRRKVAPDHVSEHLAALNYDVHLKTSDGSVGPRCIVAWRNRKDGVHKGGGGQQFYSGTTRDTSSPALPTIANGMDVRAIIGVTMPHFMRKMEAMRGGEPEKDIDVHKLDEDLAQLPDKPDENLR